MWARGIRGGSTGAARRRDARPGTAAGLLTGAVVLAGLLGAPGAVATVPSVSGSAVVGAQTGRSAARSAPTLTVVPLATAVAARWSAPTRSAGSVTAYVVSLRHRSGRGWSAWRGSTVSASTLGRTFRHLRNGRTYQVRVSAVSGGMRGPWSASRSAVAGAPAPVVTVQAWGGDSVAVVGWTAQPASHGSRLSAFRIGISRYRAGSRTWTSVAWRTLRLTGSHAVDLSRPYTVRDLRNGTAHRVSVAAVNARGIGPVTRRTVTPHVVGVVGGVRAVTVPANGSSWAFSPDGVHLAIRVCRADGDSPCAIEVVDVLTGATTLVSATPSSRTSMETQAGIQGWSPDGSRLLFTSTAPDIATDPNGTAEDAFVRDLGAGTTTRIADGPTGATDTVMAGFVGNGAVWVQRAVRAGGQPYRTVLADLGDASVTPLPADARRFAGAPDGRHIVWGAPGADPRVVLFDVASGTSTDLGPGEPYLWPTWSPDSSVVTLQSSTFRGVRLRTVATGQERPLAGHVYGLTWSPDSRRAAFDGDLGGTTSSAWTLDLATGQVNHLCPAPWSRFWPEASCAVSGGAGWSPDGRLVGLDTFATGGFVPGAPWYGGPVLRAIDGGYLLPLATSTGRTIDSRFTAGSGSSMGWLDAHHLLMTGDAVLVPGASRATTVYVKTIP